MTEDRAVELINEWLNLAKDVGDMNLNRMEYDEERYNYAMDRMNVIRQKINEYHEHMFSEDEFDEEWNDNFDLENEQVMEERDCAQCKYCEKQVIKKSNVISNIDGSDNRLIDPPPMFECQINEFLKSDFEKNKDCEDYFIEHPASMIVESPKRLNKLMNPDDVESSIYIKIDILYCPFCGRKLGISPKDFLD